ncbi:MAG: WGR domain-containing protein [Candidatus Babeliales bacterium]
MKRYFIYKDNNSDKFWVIDIIENKTQVAYGKTGTPGVRCT